MSNIFERHYIIFTYVPSYFCFKTYFSNTNVRIGECKIKPVKICSTTINELFQCYANNDFRLNDNFPNELDYFDDVR